jgi:hypothetical protein
MLQLFGTMRQESRIPLQTAAELTGPTPARSSLEKLPIQGAELNRLQPLPFPVLVTLTSNPKGIEGFPKGAELNAEMKATVDVEGRFNVIKFTVK